MKNLEEIIQYIREQTDTEVPIMDKPVVVFEWRTPAGELHSYVFPWTGLFTGDMFVTGTSLKRSYYNLHTGRICIRTDHPGDYTVNALKHVDKPAVVECREFLFSLKDGVVTKHEHFDQWLEVDITNPEAYRERTWDKDVI